jgi:2-phosphosulfolactate phosphatase
MRIDLFFTPGQVDDLALRDRAVVVIDVLRATTTLITALGEGAKEIIPAATVESAMKISASIGTDAALLAGERQGRIVPGFDLGNSPAEYRQGTVRGKSIIFTSTNGSQALAKGRYAHELALCGFVNISTVVEFLCERPRDVSILCSGNDGAFSLEDTVCAGMLVARLRERLDGDLVMSDSALAATALYRAFGRGLLTMLRTSEHGRYLQEIGFGEDLRECSSVDSTPVLPLLDGGVLRKRRTEERKEAALPPAQR